VFTYGDLIEDLNMSFLRIFEIKLVSYVDGIKYGINIASYLS
jgi:hypothetical protein